MDWQPRAMTCATCGQEMKPATLGGHLLCCGTPKSHGYWYRGDLYIGEHWPRPNGKPLKATKPGGPVDPLLVAAQSALVCAMNDALKRPRATVY